MFNSVNGVLFTGGGADLTNTTLYLAGKYIYDLALEVCHSIHYMHSYSRVALLGKQQGRLLSNLRSLHGL